MKACALSEVLFQLLKCLPYRIPSLKAHVRPRADGQGNIDTVCRQFRVLLHREPHNRVIPSTNGQNWDNGSIKTVIELEWLPGTVLQVGMSHVISKPRRGVLSKARLYGSP